MSVSRNDFLRLAGSPFETRSVPCADLGGDVLVRGLSGDERDTYEFAQFEASKASKEGRAAVGVRGTLVALAAIDGQGQRLFDPTADASWLGALPARVLDPLIDAILTLSGLTAEERKALEKNSPTPTAANAVGSDLPEN